MAYVIIGGGGDAILKGEEAKQAYDWITRYHDYVRGEFARKYAKMALGRLSIVEGGSRVRNRLWHRYCLKRVTECVGQAGKVYGIGIFSGMIERTKTKEGRKHARQICFMLRSQTPLQRAEEQSSA